MDKRLVERIEATGTGNFRGYFTLLRFQASGEELQQLTNLMTVNETYFLREEYQFSCLVDSILPEIVRHRTGPDAIRIWCIPSSSRRGAVFDRHVSAWSTGPESRSGTWRSFRQTSTPASCAVRAPDATRARSVQNVPAPWLEKYFKSVGRRISALR